MLDSILEQTFEDWEMILVDDGSNDNSLNICNEYANNDKRIKVIHQPNSGPGVARNVGIANTTGEYVYFADSDDWMDPDMLKDLYNSIREYDADMVVTNYWEEYIGHTIRTKYIEEGTHIYDNWESVKLIFTNKIFSCLEAMLFKRSVLVEPFPTDRLYEDYIILGKWIFHVNRMVTINKAYYHYRQHSISLSHKQDKFTVRKGVLKAFMQRWNYIKQTALFTKERDYFIKEYVSFIVANARDIIRSSKNLEDSKSLIGEYSSCMQQIDIHGLELPSKIKFRAIILTKHPHIFAHIMRLTTVFNKGYKRNNIKDSIKYNLYDN